MESMSMFATKEDLYKAIAMRFGKALVDFMDGTQDHDIQAATGLSDSDCKVIAEARRDANRLVYSR